MDYMEKYRGKLTTAQEAVKVIEPGMWVDYSWAECHPVALDAALAERFETEPGLTDIKVRGAMALWTPAIFNISDPAAHFVWNSWHMAGLERHAIARGNVFYTPIRYSELPRFYRDENMEPSDVCMFRVAPMDAGGYFSFGVCASHLAAMTERARIIILEVDPHIPCCLGGEQTRIHIDNVDMIVEGSASIPELAAGAAGDVDKAVAALIVAQIPDGACLQLGVGGMPNAVGSMIAQSDLKDLGVHTEMYVDAFVDLSMAGKITGARKAIDTGKQVFAFAAGTRKLYDFIDRNPACMGAPVDYTNDVRVVARLDSFISINNAIDLDLFGQVNAESSGTRHISGAGGQMDFVMGAYLSRGGKSFICCSSTFTDKAGVLHSRIRPTLAEGSIVTDTRATPMYLVTEYGMVNLKGLSAWERAEGIIALAHPDFREGLIAAAEKMHIWRRSNR